MIINTVGMNAYYYCISFLQNLLIKFVYFQKFYGLVRSLRMIFLASFDHIISPTLSGVLWGNCGFIL